MMGPSKKPYPTEFTGKVKWDSPGKVKQDRALERGEKRLKVWKQRSPDHYCIKCAIEIITRDIKTLQEIVAQLQN